jgi:hypothetical protein
MARSDRIPLIRAIETIRGSRVVCYVTSDRPYTGGQISDDALRPLYDVLDSIGKTDRLDVYIYSRGGAIDVPYRLVTAFRKIAPKWAALIPFRANSAATLTALGADEILLGRHGELGPIDPILNVQRPGGQDKVNVEDVMAYVSFMRQRIGLSDQAALTAGLAKLADSIDAVLLGNIYRTHSHIRDVARRVLGLCKDHLSDQEMARIIETLAEKVYAHGHAITSSDAKGIGLPVGEVGVDLESAMWVLLEQYSADLKLRDPVDPATAVAHQDIYTEPYIGAVIESADASFEYGGTLQITGQRTMPQQLNVNVNLSINWPQPGPTQSSIDQQANTQQMQQQIMDQLQPQIVQQSFQATVDTLRQVAPATRFDAVTRDAKWRKVI